MKKIIFYLLALCAFSSVKSASKDTSYNLADYTQSITTTVQQEYGLDVPDDIVDTLLKFVPNNKYQKGNKYQTSKVYLPNITQADLVQEEIRVYKAITFRAGIAKILRSSEGTIEALKSFREEDINLSYDKEKGRYYFWTHQPQENDCLFHIRKKSDHRRLYVGLILPALPPSPWYKADLEKKNAQNPTKKITLYKSKVCIYNDTGQLSIDLDDYERHIDEETILHVHPECTEQEIIDSITLHLRNQSEDKPHLPLLVTDGSFLVKGDFLAEVPAARPCYSALVPSDVPRSAFRRCEAPFRELLPGRGIEKYRTTIIMESYEESLYDVLKKKESELAPSCCEKMQKHKNTIGMSLLSIIVGGLAYYANFAA